uniref:Uncharacterized protein n=1 Tax=Arundo donax TaxID=35708 RepID=A0A0A8ZNY3_ARUDO
MIKLQLKSEEDAAVACATQSLPASPPNAVVLKDSSEDKRNSENWSDFEVAFEETSLAASRLQDTQLDFRAFNCAPFEPSEVLIVYSG